MGLEGSDLRTSVSGQPYPVAGLYDEWDDRILRGRLPDLANSRMDAVLSKRYIVWWLLLPF